jgi:methionine-rich copper-binding protein CopC
VTGAILVGVTHRPAARRLGALAVALLTVGVALVAGASAAQAHDVLRGTDPADGSAVALAPDHVTLTFDQPAQALGTEIDVERPDGTHISVGEPELVDTTVTQHLADERPAGVYTVQWRVTSADGHPVSGTFTFTALGATGVTTPTPAATVPAATVPAATVPTATVPTATVAATAAAVDPNAWGHGDNHVKPALVGFLLLVVAVGVGLATWLVTRRER